MCAAVADPVSLAKVSFHLSVVPLRVALNNPCAAGCLTTCFGTSCPDDSAAVQTVFWLAASESAARAKVQTAPAAISVTSFLTDSSFWACLPLVAVVQYGYSLKLRRRFADAGKTPKAPFPAPSAGQGRLTDQSTPPDDELVGAYATNSF